MSPALQADSLPPEPPGKPGGGQEEKGVTEDEIVGWLNGLSEREFEQYLGIANDREARCSAVHGVVDLTW